MGARLAGPDHGTGTGPDRTDFSAVQSQSKRPDRETVSIFGPNRTETFVAQAFIVTDHGYSSPIAITVAR